MGYLSARIECRCSDRKWTRDVNDVNPGSDGLRILEFEKKTVSWDSSLEEESWFSGACRDQTSSLRRGAARGGIRWKKQHKMKLCLSLLVSKNLKLKKVNKSFVPEPKESRQVFRVFRIRICLRTFVNVFRISMNMFISRVRILVVYFWTYMSHSALSGARVNLGAMAMKGCPVFPKSINITGTSASDFLASYLGYSLAGGSYPFAEVQSVYSTAPADWAKN